MRAFLMSIVAVFCFVCGTCFAKNVYQMQLSNAAENFTNGNFSKTIEIYESLIQIEKIKNPYIYHNLSIAYYKNGNLGKAVLNSKKALRLAPRDKEIKGNDEYLYSVLSIFPKKDLSDIILQLFSLNEITTIFATLSILLLVELSLFVVKKKLLFGNITILLAIMLAICALFFALKFYNEIVLKEAVVLSTSCVKKGTDKNSPEVFTIPEGRIVLIVDESGNMSNIKVEHDEGFIDGWIENNVIGRINE